MLNGFTSLYKNEDMIYRIDLNSVIDNFAFRKAKKIFFSLN